MRLRTCVCAASATLALTALPFATTSALADGPGDAAESTDAAPADDDPATGTVDGTITPGATTTLTAPSDTPEDVASPEDDEPSVGSEEPADPTTPVEDDPETETDDPSNTEEVPKEPTEDPTSESVDDPTISTSPEATSEGAKPTTTEPGTSTATDGGDGTATETETATEDDSATCDGDAEGDTGERGTDEEGDIRSANDAPIPRLIAQQSATTHTSGPATRN
ncbi:hypothetical protein [Brachybacterium sp. GPGPB12]|uniref:hypothetical protein n=1 Tax=Brachybacterium sp. GPGPB12 TaxID=3023517 RepID=UPI0031345266